MSAVDGLVMGRNTFEVVLTFGSWPFEGKPVVVLTNRPIDLPAEFRGRVRIDAGEPEAIVRRLAEEGHQHLYVDGGVTIQRFIQGGRLDEITITRIPVLLGTGIPLFATPGVERELELLESAALGAGLIQDRYRILKA